MQLPALALALTLLVQIAGCTAGPFADRISEPGSAAKVLVDPRLHSKLVIEIDHPEGYGPNEEALNVLRSTLVEVTGRTASQVEVRKDASIPAEPSKKYTYGEIEALEVKHRDLHTRGDTAVLYIVYVAGGSAGDDGDARVLGAAYRGTSLVIFKGNVKESTGSGGALGGGKPEERFVERAVLVHEFGHAAGLVNLGTPMVRDHEDRKDDPAGKGHSSNPESVMYWAVENSRGLQDLLQCVIGVACGSEIPYQFDADDKADLKALRES